MGCNGSKAGAEPNAVKPSSKTTSLRVNAVVDPYGDNQNAEEAAAPAAEPTRLASTSAILASAGLHASEASRGSTTASTGSQWKRGLSTGSAASSSAGVGAAAGVVAVAAAATGGGALTSKQLKRIDIKRDKELGRGGYGTVYLGVDRKTGEQFAVKEVQFDSKNLSMVKSLRGEFDVLSELRHPHIVQVFNFVVEEQKNRAHIIMEYMANGSVRSLVKQLGGALDEPSARRVLYQALLGLHYLHHKGILHRDIKPCNLLVDADGIVKLSDFGTCKETIHLASGTTTHVVGTVCYMSPEAIGGRYFPQSDIWALAATFVELVTGRMPWSERGIRQSIQLLFHIGSAKPPHHHPAFPSAVSATGQRMLLWCFSHDPRQRPTTAELLSHPYFVGGLDASFPPPDDDAPPFAEEFDSDDSFISLPPDAVVEDFERAPM